MKKTAKWTVTVLVVLLAVILLVATTSLNAIVRSAVVTVGPKLTRTEVKLDRVNISLFSGRGRIQGLEIGNPKGYDAPTAIKVGDFEIAIKPSSLLSRVVVIESILIDSPEITYEMGMGDSNLGRLMKNLGGGSPAGKETAKAKPSGEGKKVQINDLVIRNGKIRLSAKGMGGAAGAVALPTIHLTDIGKGSGGASMAETIALVLNTLLKGSGAVVKDAGKLLGSGVKEVGAAAAETTEVAGEAAKAAGEVGVRTAEAGGGAVKAVGGTAAKGLSGIAHGVGGLFSSTNKPALEGGK
jgi:hypothetical protein